MSGKKQHFESCTSCGHIFPIQRHIRYYKNNKLYTLKNTALNMIYSESMNREYAKCPQCGFREHQYAAESRDQSVGRDDLVHECLTFKAPALEIVSGDFWKLAREKYFQDPHVLAVTTNGVVKQNGELVMGRGIALAFAKLFPSLPKILGEHVKARGNIPCLVEFPDNYSVVSLPTKHHWKDDSDILLILESIFKILQIIPRNKRVLSPLPGCSNGGLDWTTYVLPRIIVGIRDSDLKINNFPFTFVEPLTLGNKISSNCN